MELVFATNNQGKLKEMRTLLAGLNIKIWSASGAGIDEDVIEDGETFFDNAYKKAEFVASKTGKYALADDSGLCIDHLNGEPGVRTARWAGENAGDRELVEHTLKTLKGVALKNRRARFKSVLVLVSPDKKYWSFKGEVEGVITESPQGKNRSSLPYDLIFQPDGFDVTFAQMSDEQKNSLSHRGKAFQKLREFLLLMQDL
ncbi:MAG: RdgB/HAM1 family non-canonical purine NTP pyrophosphatase [Patescibacteria group bacterium]